MEIIDTKFPECEFIISMNEFPIENEVNTFLYTVILTYNLLLCT